MRNTIFISHASPEDNEFTRWLSLRLAAEGYPVWTDLTKLLGGEDFWSDIEASIRTRASKFLLVLSRTSNAKPGVLQEVSVGKNTARQANLHDFMIPLLLDDIHPSEMNIEVARLNPVDFSANWAAGLHRLLEKLELDDVPKNASFSPTTVTAWWRTNFSASEGVTGEPESYISNWFPLSKFPSTLYFHKMSRSSIGRLDLPTNLPYPAILHGEFMVSFADKPDLVGFMQQGLSITDTTTFGVTDFLSNRDLAPGIDMTIRRNMVINLSRLTWEMAVSKCLPQYVLANDRVSHYFPKDFSTKGRSYFVDQDGDRRFRQLSGHKAVRSSTGDNSMYYWHFALSAKPLLYPSRAYTLSPHVLFSDNGNQVWSSKPRLHRARRSHCKNWWNADWRDRVLASISWLAGDCPYFSMNVSSSEVIEVSTTPLEFSSPVSYSVNKIEAEEEEPEYGSAEGDLFDAEPEED